MSMFCFVDALVCQRFGLLTFRWVDVSACRRFGCRRFRLSTFWPVTYKRVHFNTSQPGLVIILQTTYPNRFLQWHFIYIYNLTLHKFYFLNIICILPYIDLILSIFFQHSNIITRASHHWCLASNIVLVPPLRSRDTYAGNENKDNP